MPLRWVRGNRFVTCLCLTRNRRKWLPIAIQCFQNQTYSNRELLILADGQDVRDLLPADDDRIRLVHLAECVSIGEKRNLGCELARGEVICHWDDDDFSMPDRITEQLDLLVSSGLAVAGYHSMRFTDGLQWWQYIGDRSYALGTSLCYRRDWWQAHRFPGLQVAEDNAFVQMALQSRQLITTDGTHMMYATNHEANTSPRLPGSNWRAL